ncbi:hypothetical protein CK203_001489 [Vitis vinifera]|uniref:Uncharacterized protein n=1 Tax=Vitis vinifera TaxID=29760 RepID=A0A438KLK5_VITVI|nr:hypothetical protein CK203_001489 [Vitis vinifera]
MQVGSKARGLVRVLRAPTFLNSNRFLSHGVPAIEAPSHSSRQQWRPHSAFSSQSLPFSGIIRQRIEQHSMCSMLTARASFLPWKSVQPVCVSLEAVKELYDKMLKSVVAQTMPPNAWLWSLIEKCENHEDIKLLFDMLQNLRRFRLSNLRIHENFNCNLCREVAKACTRVGALDFGMLYECIHGFELDLLLS